VLGRSLFPFTFSSSTLALPTDLGWDTFPVNLDFALVTDIRLMPETFVAYDVGITVSYHKLLSVVVHKYLDLGLVQAEQIALQSGGVASRK